jgi:mRNA-degrading endonuclease RelE of RelBE toxin-antitoxin system
LFAEVDAKSCLDDDLMHQERVSRMEATAARVAEQPFQLVGDHPYAKARQDGSGTYQVRHGDWRAIYEVNASNDVEVVVVGNRGDINR